MKLKSKKETFSGIDPALVRNLRNLPLADYLAGKKEEYERVYPQTRNGGARARGEATHAGVPSFQVMMAAEFGVSKQNLSRILRRATIPQAVRDLIGRTRVARVDRELDLLAGLWHDAQMRVATAIRDAEDSLPLTVREAAEPLGITFPGPKPSAPGESKPRRPSLVAEAYARHAPAPELPSYMDATVPKLLHEAASLSALHIVLIADGRLDAFARAEVRRSPTIDGAELRRLCKREFLGRTDVPTPPVEVFEALIRRKQSAADGLDFMGMALDHLGYLSAGKVAPFVGARLKERPSLTPAEARELTIRKFGTRHKVPMPGERGFTDFIANVRAGK